MEYDSRLKKMKDELTGFNAGGLHTFAQESAEAYSALSHDLESLNSYLDNPNCWSDSVKNEFYTSLQTAEGLRASIEAEPPTFEPIGSSVENLITSIKDYMKAVDEVTALENDYTYYVVNGDTNKPSRPSKPETFATEEDAKKYNSSLTTYNNWCNKQNEVENAYNAATKSVNELLESCFALISEIDGLLGSSEALATDGEMSTVGLTPKQRTTTDVDGNTVNITEWVNENGVTLKEDRIIVDQEGNQVNKIIRTFYENGNTKTYDADVMVFEDSTVKGYHAEYSEDRKPIKRTMEETDYPNGDITIKRTIEYYESGDRKKDYSEEQRLANGTIKKTYFQEYKETGELTQISYRNEDGKKIERRYGVIPNDGRKYESYAEYDENDVVTRDSWTIFEDDGRKEHQDIIYDDNKEIITWSYRYENEDGSVYSDVTYYGEDHIYADYKIEKEDGNVTGIIEYENGQEVGRIEYDEEGNVLKTEGILKDKYDSEKYAEVLSKEQKILKTENATTQSTESDEDIVKKVAAQKAADLAQIRGMEKTEAIKQQQAAEEARRVAAQRDDAAYKEAVAIGEAQSKQAADRQAEYEELKKNANSGNVEVATLPPTESDVIIHESGNAKYELVKGEDGKLQYKSITVTDTDGNESVINFDESGKPIWEKGNDQNAPQSATGTDVIIHESGNAKYELVKDEEGKLQYKSITVTDTDGNESVINFDESGKPIWEKGNDQNAPQSATGTDAINPIVATQPTTERDAIDPKDSAVNASALRAEQADLTGSSNEERVEINVGGAPKPEPQTQDAPKDIVEVNNEPIKVEVEPPKPATEITPEPKQTEKYKQVEGTRTISTGTMTASVVEDASGKKYMKIEEAGRLPKYTEISEEKLAEIQKLQQSQSATNDGYYFTGANSKDIVQ